MENPKIHLNQNQIEKGNKMAKILRFLQLFAEGHYVDLQVYLQLFTLI